MSNQKNTLRYLSRVLYAICYYILYHMSILTFNDILKIFYFFGRKSLTYLHKYDII